MNAFDHNDLMIAYAADHREQLLAEAAADRLVQEARKGQQSSRFHRRLLSSVGDALIHAGRRFKMAGHTSSDPLR